MHSQIPMHTIISNNNNYVNCTVWPSPLTGISCIVQVKREKELALAKLKQVAAERDAAVKEVREMADQCKSIADEFETMAGQYEKILKGNYHV